MIYVSEKVVEKKNAHFMFINCFLKIVLIMR